MAQETMERKRCCPGFTVFWEDLELYVDCMSPKQLGNVCAALVAFVHGEEVGKLDTGEKIAFTHLRRKIAEQEEKYAQTVEQNRENGRKGAPKPPEPPKKRGRKPEINAEKNNSGNTTSKNAVITGKNEIPENAGATAGARRPTQTQTQTQTQNKNSLPPYVPSPKEPVEKEKTERSVTPPFGGPDPDLSDLQRAEEDGKAPAVTKEASSNPEGGKKEMPDGGTGAGDTFQTAPEDAIPGAAAAEKENEEHFNRFRQLYPRKPGLAAAEPYFYAALKKIGVKDLLDRLERQTRTADWQKEEGRFVPAAEKWLKEECWRDVPEDPYDRFMREAEEAHRRVAEEAEASLRKAKED